MKKEYKKPVMKARKIETLGIIMSSGYDQAIDKS